MSLFATGPVIVVGKLIVSGFKAAGAALARTYDDGEIAHLQRQQFPTCDETYWEPELKRGAKEGWTRNSHGSFLDRDFG